MRRPLISKRAPMFCCTPLWQRLTSNGSRQGSIASRGNSRCPAEAADEVRYVFETDAECDVCDGCVLMHEAPRRPSQATPDEILVRSDAQCEFESPEEV